MAADKVSAEIVQLIRAAVVLPATSYPAGENDNDRTIRTTDFANDQSHDATTTPAPTNAISAAAEIPGGGTYTLDLQAAPIIGAESSGAPASTEDITGERVYAWHFEAPSGNAGAITIGPAAANGYSLLGASGQATLQPGDYLTLYGRSAPTVAAAARYVEFTGTAGDVLNLTALTETP